MCVLKAAMRTSRKRRLTAKAKGGHCCPLESRRVLGTWRPSFGSSVTFAHMLARFIIQ
jgi:hypothetical protein